MTGTMNGGNGNNSLIFNMTGTLQYVNGNAANSGNNLSSLWPGHVGEHRGFWQDLFLGEF